MTQPNTRHQETNEQPLPLHRVLVVHLNAFTRTLQSGYVWWSHWSEEGGHKAEHMPPGQLLAFWAENKSIRVETQYV